MGCTLSCELPDTEFKLRYNNHSASFRHESNEHSTALSAQVWKIKREGVQFTIHWKMLATRKSYCPTRNTCNLCLTEKYIILFKPNEATPNNRNWGQQEKTFTFKQVNIKYMQTLHIIYIFIKFKMSQIYLEEVNQLCDQNNLL